MTRSYFELLILLLNLASADALAVIAGVLHKAMLTLDERTFRNFLKPLHKGAQRSVLPDETPATSVRPRGLGLG
ncbi:hypothetical protein [Nonomuraea rubra]|uniref:hypothetical protein n=1 Tax=Nonomuraea rubra TaxID=46180 RepID=UPI0033E52132